MLRYGDNGHLLQAITHEAVGRVGRMKQQELSNYLWGLACLGYRDNAALIAAMCSEGARRVREFNEQTLSSIVWALATLKFRDDNLMGTFAGEATRRARKFTTKANADVLWSYASLAFDAPEMFVALGTEIARRDDAYAQHSASALWSLVIAGGVSHDRNAAVETLFRRCCQADASAWSEESLRQIAQAQMALRCEAYVRSEVAENTVENARLAANAEVMNLPSIELQQSIANVRGDHVSSQVSKQISSMLKSIGWEHEVDVALEGGVVVDMLGEDGKLVIVDGPWHFTRSPASGEERENGPLLWTMRILRMGGCRVVKIGHRQWRDAQSLGNGEQLLANLLLTK